MSDLPHKRRDFFRTKMRKEYYQIAFLRTRTIFSQQCTDSSNFYQIVQKITLLTEKRQAISSQQTFQRLRELQEWLKANNHSQRQSKHIFLLLFSFLKKTFKNNFMIQQSLEPSQNQLLDRILNIFIQLNNPILQRQQLIDFFTLLKQITNRFIGKEQLITVSCLKVICSLMNPQSQETMKQLALGLHLTRWMEAEYTRLSACHHPFLLQLLYLYLSTEHPTDQTVEDPASDSICLSGIDSTQKQKMLIYCLLMLQSKQDSLLSCTLSCIILIFQLHFYLTTLMQKEDVFRLCELLFDADRKVQSKSMECMSSIVYYDSHNSHCEELLKDNYLPDCLLKILLREEGQASNEESINIVDHCANTLCNLTLCSSRPLKRMLVRHSIWNYAFQHMRPATKHFRIIVAFQYYFRIADRTTIISMLEAFLAVVRSIDLTQAQVRQSKSIEDTLIYLYRETKQFWPERQFQWFMALINTYSLSPLLNTIMDLEEDQR